MWKYECRKCGHKHDEYVGCPLCRIEGTTTNTVDTGDYRSPDDIIAALERFLECPRLIGNLHGYPVYVDGSLPPGTVEIRAGENTMRFSVDHPYIQGTKLEAAARAALLDPEQTEDQP